MYYIILYNVFYYCIIILLHGITIPCCINTPTVPAWLRLLKGNHSEIHSCNQNLGKIVKLNIKLCLENCVCILSRMAVWRLPHRAAVQDPTAGEAKALEVRRDFPQALASETKTRRDLCTLREPSGGTNFCELQQKGNDQRKFSSNNVLQSNNDKSVLLKS